MPSRSRLQDLPLEILYNILGFVTAPTRPYPYFPPYDRSRYVQFGPWTTISGLLEDEDLYAAAIDAHFRENEVSILLCIECQVNRELLAGIVEQESSFYDSPLSYQRTQKLHIEFEECWNEKIAEGFMKKTCQIIRQCESLTRLTISLDDVAVGYVEGLKHEVERAVDRKAKDDNRSIRVYYDGTPIAQRWIDWIHSGRSM